MIAFRAIVLALIFGAGIAWNAPLSPRVLRHDGSPSVDRRTAFSSGLALVAGLAAVNPSKAAVQIDPGQVKTTKNGVKYVVVKEGACPLIDPSGALGSCFPAPEKYVIMGRTKT